MNYAVKEIFYSLQGEGYWTGRPAVFIRFAGCNLWSGRERDRATAKGVCARFCDTDFAGLDGELGSLYGTPGEMVAAAFSLWPKTLKPTMKPYVVLTGGEPTLQIDPPLCKVLRDAGFEIAVETNGRLPIVGEVDWVTVSPKAPDATMLGTRSGNEIKLAFPQEGAEPERFETGFNFDHYWIQPIANSAVNYPNAEFYKNAEKAAAYCLANPRWRLSTQVHKVVRLP